MIYLLQWLSMALRAKIRILVVFQANFGSSRSIPSFVSYSKSHKCNGDHGPATNVAPNIHNWIVTGYRGYRLRAALGLPNGISQFLSHHVLFESKPIPSIPNLFLLWGLIIFAVNF